MGPRYLLLHISLWARPPEYYLVVYFVPRNAFAHLALDSNSSRHHLSRCFRHELETMPGPAPGPSRMRDLFPDFGSSAGLYGPGNSAICGYTTLYPFPSGFELLKYVFRNGFSSSADVPFSGSARRCASVSATDTSASGRRR